MKTILLTMLAAGLLLIGCDSNEPNAPPGTPRVIRGTDSAGVDDRVEVLVTADDPDAAALTYEVDWGDGREYDVYPGVESGLWFPIVHHYFHSGRYSMRCRATNAHGRISAWSEPWTITIDGDAVVGRGDWWMFMRDAQHSGHSPFVGPSIPVLKWKMKTASPIRSSVAFDAAGNAYFGGDDFSLRAVYPDGTLRWKYTTGLARIRNAPAMHHDGSAAFGSSSANIYRIDVSGAKLWIYSVGAPVLRSNAVRDEEGNTYIGSEDFALYCLRPDGALRWRFATGAAVEGSPALSRDGGTVYIGGRDQIFYALGSGDGQPRWTFPTMAPFSGSPSVGPNNEILIGDEAGWLYSFRPDGSLAWRTQLHSPIRTTPAVTRDAFVHVITSDGKLFKLDSEGKILWDISLAQASGDGSPAVDVNGTVYAGTPDGRLSAVSAAGKLLWRFEVPEAIHTTPAIGPDGAVAFGSDDEYLYVLRER
jgi:outer membrane protein assembly factor BamB